MKKLRVVQIGAEHDHASCAFRSLLKQNDIFDLIGYVVPEDEPTLYYERNYGTYKNSSKLTLEEAFADPDLDGAVIETSEKNLTKYARLAADRGLAIHMDKPGGDVPEEFDELLQVLEAKKLVFSTGYMYRPNPAVQELLRMADSGELGEILYVEAHMNCIHDAEKRDWLKKYKGGMMFFLGCHLVDLIIRLQGDPLEIIPMNYCSGLDGVQSEECGFALFRYPNGISFAKTTAVEIGGFMRRQLVVVGSKATVEINPLEYFTDPNDGAVLCTDMFVTTAKDQEVKHWGARGEKKTFGPFDRYDTMLRTYAEAALGIRNTLPSLEYEKKIYHDVMKACGIE